MGFITDTELTEVGLGLPHFYRILIDDFGHLKLRKNIISAGLGQRISNSCGVDSKKNVYL